MTLQQLFYVIETDKLGSFNKAAQSLYVTRQSLASSINALEAEIGIKIFDRTNKGLQTTEEGSSFINMAKNVTAAYEYLQENYSDKTKKNVRLNLVSIPNYFVETTFSKFCAINNDCTYMNVTLKTTDSFKALDDVYSSQAEVGIVMIGESHKSVWANELHAKGLEYYKLMDAQISVLLSTNDPLAGHSSISPEQLEGYSFVFWATSTKNILNILPESSAFAKQIIKNNRYINAQYQTTLFMMLEKAKSFALNFGGLNEHFQVFPVVNVPLSEELNFELVCIKQKHRTLSREADAFIKLLMENIQKSKKLA